MKNKLLLTIGAPGSGKSTWRRTHWKGEVVSPDKIRREVFDVQFDQTLENKVWSIVYEELRKHLKAGKDVCLDATNATISRRKKLIDLAKEYEANCEAVCFILPLEVLYERNESRPPGKQLNPELIKMLYEIVEIPDITEGFTNIKIINNANENFS